jgi:hypothetical protein
MFSAPGGKATSVSVIAAVDKMFLVALQYRPLDALETSRRHTKVANYSEMRQARGPQAHAFQQG